MPQDGPGRAWWTDAQRERLRQFNDDLHKRVVRTVGWSSLFRELQQRFPGITDSRLDDWVRIGVWDPRVLYEACDIVGYDPWLAAVAIGALPYDASDLERALQASTVLAVERYYQRKEGSRGTQADEVRQRVRTALPGYEVHAIQMERGDEERRAYHTCLVFVDQELDLDDPLAELERAARRDQLRRVVDHVLQDEDLPVCAHWEHSAECKPEGLQMHEVLIVEDAFDNRVPLSNPLVLRRWSELTPIVVLGVHYSGAKDVGTELARLLDLGSLDIGRYMGEVFGERLPFRRETNLQGQLFENVTSSLLGSKLVITVDDYQALQSLEGRRHDRFPGTAVLLKLDAELLEYAAFRIWTGMERDERPDAPDVRSLKAAQAALERLSRRFAHSLPAVPISCPDIERGQDGFADQVDDMFDTYMRAAKTLQERLLRLRPPPNGRGQR